MFPLKDTLFNICCWYINLTSCQQHYTSCPDEGSLTPFFSQVTAFWCSTLDRMSALYLGGAVLNSELTNSQHKNMQNMTLNRMCEEHRFTVWELEQDGRVPPRSTAAGNARVHGETPVSPHSVPFLHQPWQCPRLLTLGLQTEFSEKVISKLWNL